MVDVQEVDRVLARGVSSGVAPGVIALAADEDGVVYAGAFGTRGIGDSPDMSLDTVVWIASMTKAVTSVAAMQLVERGVIALDEPLGSRVPDLATLQILDGFDTDGMPRLRPSRRPLTLRHLLTHTAGFGYDIWNANLRRYKAEHGHLSNNSGKDGYLSIPLVFEPGDSWEYGINIDWVGEAVEILSGQSLEKYFREHIFDPLGMGDTSFHIESDQQVRLANMHARQPDGSLETVTFGPSQPPKYYEGGGGLYSTGPDYLRFLRVLLGDGRLGDARLLRPETVAEMGRNQIGKLTAGVLRTADPFKSNDVELFPGIAKKWGLGYMITTEATPTGRAAGGLTWAGLANTYYWIDPARRVTGLLLTQVLPFGDPGVLDLFADYERAIYAGLA